MPLVTVVIPTFNRKAQLRRAVDSVLRQSFEDYQIHIVDDGSTDNSVRDLQADLSEHEKITFHYLPENLGVSAARNHAIRHSESEFIALLDSDDEWLPNKLQLQIEALGPHSAMVHSNEIWLRGDTPVPQRKKHQKGGDDQFIPSLKLCVISPSTSVIRRSTLDEVGLFREDFPVCEDYELWLRITHKYPLSFVEEALVIKHGGHDDQLSFKYHSMDYWRVKALLPFLKSARDEDSKQAVQAELKRKCHVLLKGFEKHGNLSSQYSEVAEILSQLEP